MDLRSLFISITHYYCHVYFIWLIIICTGCGESNTPPAGSHNIILIYADDLSPQTIEPYGQKVIKTPRLNQMAEEGILFKRGYSSATSCAPARIALLLGKHLGHIDRKLNSNEDRLLREDLCFPELLRDHGYQTAMFGKQHGTHFRNWFGLTTQIVDDTPYDHGFDRFVGMLSAVEAHQFYLDGITNPDAKNPKHLWQEKNANISRYKIPPTRYTHNEFMDLSIKFIEDNQEDPFFLFLPIQIPHFEQVVPMKADPDYHEEDVGLYEQYLKEDGTSVFEEEPWEGTHPENRRPVDYPLATFASLISRMDRDVGRILDKLTELGKDGNTLVIFTADNGFGGWPREAMTVFNPTGNFRAAKGRLYEGGIRVPFLFWGAGIQQGTVINEPIAAYDLAATILDFANVDRPYQSDGISWKDALTSGELPKREYLYWENYISASRQATLIDNQNKVIKVKNHDNTYTIQLFDLDKDESEKINLATDSNYTDVLYRAQEIFELEHVPTEDFYIPNNF